MQISCLNIVLMSKKIYKKHLIEELNTKRYPVFFSNKA